MSSTVLYLNVRGTHFCANSAFLNNHKDSKLYELVISEPTLDRDNNIFLDVNPKIFELVMDYLKHKKLPAETKSDQDMYLKFKKEVEYFGLTTNLEPLSDYIIYRFVSIKTQNPCDKTEAELKKLRLLTDNSEYKNMIDTELTKYDEGYMIMVAESKSSDYPHYLLNKINITFTVNMIKYKFVVVFKQKIKQDLKNCKEFLNFIGYIDKIKYMKLHVTVKSSNIKRLQNKIDKVDHYNKITTYIDVFKPTTCLAAAFKYTYNDNIIRRIREAGKKCFDKFVEVDEFD